MPPHHMMQLINNLEIMRIGSEILYTFVIVMICAFIYIRTKEIYSLTKHEGIKYFRNGFLFFGLAYLSRILLHLVSLTSWAYEFLIPRCFYNPVAMIAVSYMSTMALFYITYSIVWKKIKYKHIVLFANIIALLISVLAFVSRSALIIGLIQLALLISIIVFSIFMHKKSKNHSKALYLLIAIFWLLNILATGTSTIIFFQINLVFQLLSIGVFFMIFYKVMRLTK